MKAAFLETDGLVREQFQRNRKSRQELLFLRVVAVRRQRRVGQTQNIRRLHVARRVVRRRRETGERIRVERRRGLQMGGLMKWNSLLTIRRRTGHQRGDATLVAIGRRVLLVVLSRLFRQLFAGQLLTTVNAQTLSAEQLTEDAERNEIRRRVDDGDQIGDAVKATNERAERRMKEDLDRELEGPEDPEHDRRTAAEQQGENHGDDHDRHGIFRRLVMAAVRTFRMRVDLSQAFSTGFQPTESTNQLHVDGDDRQGRQRIDEDDVEKHVRPAKEASFA